MCVCETAIRWSCSASFLALPALGDGAAEAGEKSPECESRRRLPPPLHSLSPVFVFCTCRRSKPRQPIIRAEHSATLEKASSDPQRGVTLQRKINGSEQQARERTQRWAVLFARLIVSGGSHVPDDWTPWIAILWMSLLFGATKCLNYRENCFGICVREINDFVLHHVGVKPIFAKDLSLPVLSPHTRGRNTAKNGVT